MTYTVNQLIVQIIASARSQPTQEQTVAFLAELRDEIDTLASLGNDALRYYASKLEQNDSTS